MEKAVKIGDKEYRLRSSLLTIIDYKNTFGTDLFDDVTRLSVENKSSKDLTKVIEVLFQIIYILNKPFNKISYEEFLSGFDFAVITDKDTLETVTGIIGEFLTQSKSKPAEPANP